MRNLPMAVCAALLLVGPALAERATPSAGALDEPASETAAATPSDEALAFVSDFSDEHLSGMLSRVGGQSQTMRELSRIDARLLAAAFETEIDAAVERHGDEWAHNLALAWTPVLTDAEMASLSTEGAESPHVQKYTEGREEAAVEMARLSQDLFREIMGEVMQNTLATLSGEVPRAD